MGAVLGQQLAGAVLLGVLYAMIAIGFSLYFGVLNVIQFSHGAFVTVGVFVVLAVVSTGVHSLGALFVIAIVATGLLGVVFARLVVRPLLNAPELIVLIATLAAGQALRELIRIFYPQGSRVQHFPQLFPSTPLHIEGVLIRVSQIWIVAIGAVAIVLTALFVQRSPLGRKMRAVAQDRQAAQMMGISLGRVVAVTFLIASGLAAVAGILYGSYYNTVQFDLGASIGVIGFAAAVMGGLGSIYGAVVGGFIFAFVETLSAAFVPQGSENADIIAYGLVILFLVFRPQGVLGDKAAERV